MLFKGMRFIVLSAVIGAMCTFGMAQNRMVSDTNISQKVRKELSTLPYYGIFDNLEYQVNGGTVTLIGQVVRPTTKDDAAGRVKRIPGVTNVVNDIQVLPLSPMDDRIRAAEYRAIFSEPGLQKYSMGADPSIHIIVDNGHVTLEGYVLNSGDRNAANIRANQVAGVFSVTNNLKIASQRK
ncbi:MAG TPA: BON domain-containing protein [Blastocatellia bacterium]|nr:BON domain-containing protein [Blastocatellia bacterium]